MFSQWSTAKFALCLSYPQLYCGLYCVNETGVIPEPYRP